MCTLIAIHRQIAGAPLVIAANRDEYLDRPSQGPALRTGRGGQLVAPLDLRAGGTWLGVSERGVFAAVTNRPCPEPDRTRRSRGEVVMDALAEPTAEAAARRFEELPKAAWNPFNAFVADRQRAFALVYQDLPQVKEMAPGAHVIGNADPDARDVPKVARVLARAEAAARQPLPAALTALEAACKEHDGGEASLQDTCIHLSGYGTRSSTLLVLGDAPGTDRLLFADGPACESPYEDFTHLLESLGQTARDEAGEEDMRKAI